jgi:hypothetical protein
VNRIVVFLIIVYTTTTLASDMTHEYVMSHWYCNDLLSKAMEMTLRANFVHSTSNDEGRDASKEYGLGYQYIKGIAITRKYDENSSHTFHFSYDGSSPTIVAQYSAFPTQNPYFRPVFETPQLILSEQHRDKKLSHRLVLKKFRSHDTQTAFLRAPSSLHEKKQYLMWPATKLNIIQQLETIKNIHNSIFSQTKNQDQPAIEQYAQTLSINELKQQPTSGDTVPCTKSMQ